MNLRFFLASVFHRCRICARSDKTIGYLPTPSDKLSPKPQFVLYSEISILTDFWQIIRITIPTMCHSLTQPIQPGCVRYAFMLMIKYSDMVCKFTCYWFSNPLTTLFI